MICLTGVPSYEVLWVDIDGQYEALIPDDQFEGIKYASYYVLKPLLK